MKSHALAQLDACRRWLLEHFDAALQRMLDRADETLYALSESKSEQSQPDNSTSAEPRPDDAMQAAYFDLMRSLRLQHERLHGATHAELGAHLGAMLKGRQITRSRDTGGDLLLEETLATDAMATRVEIACDDAATLPGQRVAALMAAAGVEIRPEAKGGELLEPRIFCTALHGAVHTLPLDVTAKAVLLKLLERHMAPELVGLYGALGAALDDIIGVPSTPSVHITGPDTSDAAAARRGGSGQADPGTNSIQAAVKRLVRQTPGDGAERNAGWQLRDALVARRAALRQHVATGLPWPADVLGPVEPPTQQALPSHILAAEALVHLACARTATDASIPGPSGAALEACVRVALLLLAIKDATAVLDARHPAQHVLLLVKEFVARTDADASEDLILAVCADLLAERPDLDSVRSNLRALIEPLPVNSPPTSANLAKANEFAERELSRRLAAAPVPTMVKRFALDYWKGLVVTEHVQHGEQSSACQQSLETMDTLLWSLAPKYEADEREQLVSALPQLLESLERGMERIGMPEEGRGELIASLAACHADIIRGQAPSHTLREPQSNAQTTVANTQLKAANTGGPGLKADKRKGEPAQLLAKAMKRANLHIFKTARNQSSCKGIQSSLACVWFQAQQVTLARAGSAGLFRLRDDKLESLLGNPDATDDAAPLGKHAELTPRIATSTTMPGETYILCTDGLTSVLGADELSAVCSQHETDAEAAAQALLKVATRRGLKDNASVAVVRTHGASDGTMVLECASASGRGTERDFDQEATICDTSNRFALVCDGIGGTRSGHIASGIAACSISEDLSKATRRFNLEPKVDNARSGPELAPWDDGLMDRESNLFAPYAALDNSATTAEQATLKLAAQLSQTSASARVPTAALEAP